MVKRASRSKRTKRATSKTTSKRRYRKRSSTKRRKCGCRKHRRHHRK